MFTRLRNIAVTVEETEPGVFFWYLIESTDDPTVYLELFGSLEGFERWDEALDAGVKTFKGLAINRLIGPQTTGEDEEADPDS